MNQHKVLYQQICATYQLNNRTFSTQNTKISARSLAISYIMFSGTYCKQKIEGICHADKCYMLAQNELHT